MHKRLREGTIKRGIGKIVEHCERCLPYKLSHSRNTYYLKVIKEFTEVFRLTPRTYHWSLWVHVHHRTIPILFPWHNVSWNEKKPSFIWTENLVDDDWFWTFHRQHTFIRPKNPVADTRNLIWELSKNTVVDVWIQTFDGQQTFIWMKNPVVDTRN